MTWAMREQAPAEHGTAVRALVDAEHRAMFPQLTTARPGMYHIGVAFIYVKAVKEKLGMIL